jgi:hypothetical protein
MAMSRSIGGSSFTTLPSIEMSPDEIASRPGDHAQGRGLAAARRADEHHELLVADLQVDVFDGVDAVVELVDALEDDLPHTLHPCARSALFQPLTEPVSPAT